ncbi:MAG: hypothetical protein ACM31L_13880 [Actinomycetota bacterium]
MVTRINTTTAPGASHGFRALSVLEMRMFPFALSEANLKKATFGADGKYGSDGLQHAVIFDRYEINNGRPGMNVIERRTE